MNDKFFILSFGFRQKLPALTDIINNVILINVARKDFALKGVLLCRQNLKVVVLQATDRQNSHFRLREQARNTYGLKTNW